MQVMKTTRDCSRRLVMLLVPLMLLISLLPPPLPAQPAPVRSANFTYRTDYDTTTVTYCKMVGEGENPWSPGTIAGTARIETTGSSTTVTAVTAGQNPFARLAVDDVIVVQLPSGVTPGTYVRRTITAKASADSVTVDTAVNLDYTNGVVFRWLDLQCGATDADGWIDTGGYSTKTVTFLLEQISGTGGGIDMRVECKGQYVGALPNIIHPGTSTACGPGTAAGGYCNFATAGLTAGRFAVAISPDIPCGAVRVGVKINTSDAAEAVEGDKERVTIGLDWESGR